MSTIFLKKTTQMTNRTDSAQLNRTHRMTDTVLRKRHKSVTTLGSE